MDKIKHTDILPSDVLEKLTCEQEVANDLLESINQDIEKLKAIGVFVAVEKVSTNGDFMSLTFK